MVSNHIKPLSAEQSLYLTENRLDWVKLWTVRHIPDRHDIEIIVLELHSPFPMHSKVVHKESKWLVSVVAPQLLKIA